MRNVKAFEKIFENATRSPLVHEGFLLLENTKGDFSASFSYGGKDADSPICSASIGKLYTTSCILILCEQNKLSLSDPLGKYFEKPVLNGLHRYKGTEYSHKLTVADLLFQNSGLPDWFEEGGGKMEAIKSDFLLTFEEKLARTKKLNAHFAPGSAKRAYYSDFNFDLLGEIIENITGMPLEKVFKDFLFDPLGLTKTYMPTSEKDFIPKIYYKNKSFYRPKMIITARAGGALITTVGETMLFLKAFWNYSIFSRSIFDDLAVYRKLQRTMGPLYYGGGYMQIPMNSLHTLYMGKGELIGHSGSTACGAFYYKLKNLYIVCDFNQMANPALPIMVTMKLAMAAK